MEDGAASVPVYLTASQVNQILAEESYPNLQESYESSSSESNSETLLAWVGSYKGQDYWVIRIKTDLATSDLPVDDSNNAAFANLREFGDRLEHRIDAGILATANGLVEFHTTHGYCSRCGSQTTCQKAGACRRCVGCGRSAYPRLDVATIMLITSPCGEYALLGRKSGWPKGRFSTLAGFAEVGETLEECCARETLEESGVRVDRRSIAFVASQPWPFPRSLMVGFQAKAAAGVEVDNATGLPRITVQPEEMEQIRWFTKEFVRERLGGGSTAQSFVPNATEAEFRIPGKSSLARLLITRWAKQ